MKITDVEQGLNEYGDAFTSFLSQYPLPSSLFLRPDHFAVKCADEIDYFDTCHNIRPYVDDEGIWELSLDGRMLATASLRQAVAVGDFRFSWVEIMQPRPGKELPKGFVEHTEFFVDDLFGVERTLRRFGVSSERQENPGHAWLNVVIDDEGREIKFNDKLIRDVVAKEKEQGILRKILDQ